MAEITIGVFSRQVKKSSGISLVLKNTNSIKRLTNNLYNPYLVLKNINSIKRLTNSQYKPYLISRPLNTYLARLNPPYYIGDISAGVDGYIEGHTKKLGSIVINKDVILIYTRTGALVDKKRSDSSGYFRFNNLVVGSTDYCVLALDDTYNAVVYDKVVPSL
jgi:hypothetical protein